MSDNPVDMRDGATIGANAVITRDIPPGATVVGADRIESTQHGPVPGAAEAALGPNVTNFPLNSLRNSQR